MVTICKLLENVLSNVVTICKLPGNVLSNVVTICKLPGNVLSNEVTICKLPGNVLSNVVTICKLPGNVLSNVVTICKLPGNVLSNVVTICKLPGNVLSYEVTICKSFQKINYPALTIPSFRDRQLAFKVMSNIQQVFHQLTYRQVTSYSFIQQQPFKCCLGSNSDCILENNSFNYVYFFVNGSVSHNTPI